jgi:hypothetical protein
MELTQNQWDLLDYLYDKGFKVARAIIQNDWEAGRPSSIPVTSIALKGNRILFTRANADAMPILEKSREV